MSSTPRDVYIGQPAYPAPSTTLEPREGLRDIDEARIVCLAPDVCLTPIGSSVVPIPYQIVDYCGHDRDYASSVRFTKRRSMVLRSRTTHVHGDAPGTRKGVRSATVENVTEPIGHAPQVRAEGSPVIRHLDRFWMNNRNTQGEALFVRDTRTFEPPSDDDPVPGSLLLIVSAPANPVQQAQSNAGTIPGNPPRTQTGGTTTTTTRPTNVPRLGRRGLWGTLLAEMARDLSMSPEERAVEARAMRAFMAGDQVIIDERLLAGRKPIGFSNMGDLFSSESWQGRYGFAVGGDERVALANDILTSMAGRAVDVRTATDAEVEAILGGRGVAAPQSYEEAQRNAEALRRAGVRVAAASLARGACLVGPHNLIRRVCPGESHHIVPDMTLGWGTRAQRERGETRIDNAPSFGNGVAICLTNEMHSGLHTSLNARLKDIGERYNPTGTAPMLEIVDASIDSLNRISGLPPQCKRIAVTAVQAQTLSMLGQPGRTTTTLPSSDAVIVMEKGHY